MTTLSVSFTTPVGRLIGGSVSTPRTTDYDGKPLVIKSGQNAGQPRKDFSFGVAIPKTPGVQSWIHEPWGAKIFQLAQQSFPQGEWQRPDFAWKIIDGDSAIPNKRNKKPCEQEGYRGHWVIWFSGSIQPRLYNADGTQQITDPQAIKLGYYVQVFCNVTDNKPSQSPGLYINHSMVALSAYGPEIVIGPDVSQAGFGNAPLPQGASPMPVGGAFNPAASMPGQVASAPPVANGGLPSSPALPYVQGGPAPANAPYVATNGTAVPSPLPMQNGPVATVAVPQPSAVTPNPAFLGSAANMATTPQVSARVMLPSAGGIPYEAWIQQGWTDALLIQHGKMAA